MMRFVLLAALNAAVGFAQQPAFEVAAIKPSNAGDSGTHWRSGKGRIDMNNLTLRQIIQAAYGLQDYRVSGGPTWVDSERFNIDAKAETKVEDTQLMPMLQTLLAERFKLAVHRENKEVTGYALVVAKGGPKIHAVDGEGSSSSGGGGKLTAKHLPMAKLADLLARQVGRPVVD